MQQSILRRKEDEIEMAPKKKSRHIKSLKSASARFTVNTPDTTQWLALLCELSLQFETETRLDDLLQRMLVQLLDVLPGATRGALLLCDQSTDVLLLKAYVPPDKPAVNKILVRQAISTGKGFTWQRDEEDSTTDSMAGMYVPLIWQGKALGAICVDT
ncbi:MAG: hypothetical protein GY801_12065, partial [bacterium]|nr:hypothetical protein [bacterium]